MNVWYCLIKEPCGWEDACHKSRHGGSTFDPMIQALIHETYRVRFHFILSYGIMFRDMVRYM